MSRSARTGAAALLLFAASCATTSTPSPAPARGGARPQATAARPGMPRSPSDTTPAPGGGGGAFPAGGAAGADRPAPEPSPRAYGAVVTPAAQTRRGMFRTHRIGSRLLFEIPKSEMNREMLLVGRVARTTLGSGYGGTQTQNRVVRWERRGNRVLLRGISYQIMADSALPIYRAVQAANYDAVVAAFNVEAWSPDSAAVIDVTRLYTTASPELGVGNLVRGQLDPARSFVERAAAFPRNVEVEATQTFTVTPPTPPGADGLPEQFRPQPRTASVLMHWSMVRLPDDPMMPRLADPRVGYFTQERADYGATEHEVTDRRYIVRYRLEKKDPSAAVSEPVQPIVYYVDPATPAQWVPWVKRGIEAWQPAFEAAGFRNGIVAREAPKDDPDWSPEDARYSVIRWMPSETQNAVGPNVHDPRTGQILEADVEIYHNVQRLARNWYFTQVGPLDPRAARLPLPDSLMGRLIAYVVTHEVGHTLGFPHNMKASSTYPIDSLRSASFLRRMGHTPTLMDYSRFNYVAQPEDNIPVDLLIPRVGPYDVFAVQWGYTPIPGARTPEAEVPTLSQWASVQDRQPWLRFSTPGTNGADPGELTEAVGDQDAVRATTYGLRNLRRVMQMLIPAAERPGRDYDDLQDIYTSTVNQWRTEMTHVAQIVGGVESQERYGGGVRYRPLPRERQKAAVAFLNENAFRTPDFLVDPQVLRRVEVEGTMDRVGTAQRGVLSSLLSDARLRRLAEFEAVDRTSAYPLAEMLADVRRGVWSEAASGGRIDPFRRNLQRAYLDLADEKINPRPQQNPVIIFGGGQQGQQLRPSAEARAMLRSELRALDAQIRRAIPSAPDAATRAHLEDSRDRIARILDPEK